MVCFVNEFPLGYDPIILDDLEHPIDYAAEPFPNSLNAIEQQVSKLFEGGVWIVRLFACPVTGRAQFRGNGEEYVGERLSRDPFVHGDRLHPALLEVKRNDAVPGPLVRVRYPNI